jgi:hypothetical protein
MSLSAIVTTAGTWGLHLAQLYQMQDWEVFADKKRDDPYAPGYFFNHVAGALSGLANVTRKTAMGRLPTQQCFVCGAPVDLARTVGDHIIATQWGGPETVQNALLLCRAHNSSKGTKDLLEWWVQKGWPVASLHRSDLCLYARAHWQLWGPQVHREPAPPYLCTFVTQRTAAFPSDAHRLALAGAAQQVCVLAQRQAPEGSCPPPYLSYYGITPFVPVRTPTAV